MKDDRTAVQRSEDMVQADLYEDLLNRYERVLVFAGQLQEKARQQKLLSDQNQSLEGDVKRLNRLVDVERSYVRLLEGALASLGVLKGIPLFPSPNQSKQASTRIRTMEVIRLRRQLRATSTSSS